MSNLWSTRTELQRPKEKIVVSTKILRMVASSFALMLSREVVDASSYILDLREYDVTYYTRCSIDKHMRCGEWYDVTVRAGEVSMDLKKELGGTAPPFKVRTSASYLMQLGSCIRYRMYKEASKVSRSRPRRRSHDDILHG